MLKKRKGEQVNEKETKVERMYFEVSLNIKEKGRLEFSHHF